MRHRKLLCAMLAALLALAYGAAALAKVPSPSKEFYFYDEANVLSEATRGEIFYSNQLLNDACGAQIVIAAVRTTGSTEISDYTDELFNTWGIGDAEAMNGFLLVMAIDDDDYYAVCGYNLQPTLTSSTLNDYFDRYLESDFAARNYDAGARKFFEAVFKRVADTYNAGVTVQQGIAQYEAWKAQGDSAAWSARSGGGRSIASGNTANSGSDSGIMVATVVVILLIAVLMLVSQSRRRRRGIFPPPPPPIVGPPAGRGGYRGVQPPPPPPPVTRPARRPPSNPFGGFGGFGGSSGSGRSHSSGAGGFRSSGSSGASRPSAPSRPSGSFGSASGGGGRSGGGGAGRGRH
ncbi:MAG: TPM domain-containing protein [bacterium]